MATIVDTFLHLQPELFLTETLDICTALEARYYIEADANSPEHTQEMLRDNTKQASRVQFFRVRYVANGQVQTARPCLFLKVLLAPCHILEAVVHRAIDSICQPHTPNLIVTHYVRVIDEGEFTLQYMLLQYGIPLQKAISSIVTRCNYTEYEDMLLSCFFQCFHAIAILHAYRFQHRDVRPENWISAPAVRSPVTHYIIEGIHYRIPVVWHGIVSLPMLLDFGLAEPIDNTDSVINNVEPNLAPDFVFFTNYQKSVDYSNSDEVFSTALSLLIMMKKFDFPDIDPGILRHVRSLFQNQRFVASPMIAELINIRDLHLLTHQAFSLVLLLGFPSPEECPAFFASQVGKYMFTQIGDYIRNLPCYNYLDSQYGEVFSVLRRMLKWRRGDRPSAKEILCLPHFSRFITDRDPRCAEKPHYICPEDEAMDTL